MNQELQIKKKYKPKVTPHSLRCEDQLWQRWLQYVDRTGRTQTNEFKRMMTEYLDKYEKQHDSDKR